MPTDVPSANNIEHCNDWKDDTMCDDVCNVPEFQFDGGDCCLDLVVTNFCSHCFCYDDCSFHDQIELPTITLTPVINVTETPWRFDSTTMANFEGKIKISF